MIYFDMDGTLATWNWVGPDVWTKPGYFENLAPYKNVCDAVRILLNRGIEVGILSAVLDDLRTEEKNNWLDKNLPEVKNRVFIPYGKSKNAFLNSSSDVLIDDYSANLHEWGGIGIKCKNGLNGTKGTWKGFVISKEQDPEFIADTIQAISNFKKTA